MQAVEVRNQQEETSEEREETKYWKDNYWNHEQVAGMEQVACVRGDHGGRLRWRARGGMEGAVEE